MDEKNPNIPSHWEEIHGFATPGEYKRFVAYIECQIASDQVKEIKPDNNHSKIRMFGIRWFQDIESGAVWQLVEPDIPFRGTWEPVKLTSSER